MWSREFDSLQVSLQIGDDFTEERIVPIEFLAADCSPDDVVNGRGDIRMRIVS